MNRLKVIIESPYAGNVALNVKYARERIRDSVLAGEAPIASHLLYTQEGILDDSIPEERENGIQAGLAWRCVADLSRFCVDLGWSRGMLEALRSAIKEGRAFELFRVYNDVDWPALPDDLKYMYVSGGKMSVVFNDGDGFCG